MGQLVYWSIGPLGFFIGWCFSHFSVGWLVPSLLGDLVGWSSLPQLVGLPVGQSLGGFVGPFVQCPLVSWSSLVGWSLCQYGCPSVDTLAGMPFDSRSIHLFVVCVPRLVSQSVLVSWFVGRLVLHFVGPLLEWSASWLVGLLTALSVP